MFDKYSKKIKENKLRIAYLVGFCLCFRLGPLYDRKLIITLSCLSVLAL